MTTTSSIPTRSDSQRLDALAKANVIRRWRAQLKIDLKARLIGVLDILELAEHPYSETWKVYDILKATPKIGPVKANSIMRRELISPSKTIHGLSSRQRVALRAALAPYHVHALLRLAA